MATPQCMSNDGNAAIFVGTFFPSGDTVALCNDCMPAWSSAVTSQMLGIDPELFAVAVAAMEQDAEKAATADPTQTGAPPAMLEHGAPSDEPPAPAPADTDPGAQAPEVAEPLEEPPEPLQVGDEVE